MVLSEEGGMVGVTLQKVAISGFIFRSYKELVDFNVFITTFILFYSLRCHGGELIAPLVPSLNQLLLAVSPNPGYAANKHWSI